MRLIYLLLRAVLLHPLRSALAGFWWLVGKKQRARNRFGIILDDEQRRYEKWLKQRKAMDEDSRQQLAARVAEFSINAPVLLLCEVPDANAAGLMRASIRALEAQLYRNWILYLTGTGARALVDGDDDRIRLLPDGQEAVHALMADVAYVGWLRPGDRLAEGALFEFMAAAEQARPSLIYCDEDQVNHRNKRRFAHFKPSWNFELLLACDYIGGLALIRADRALAVTLPYGAASWQTRYQMLLLIGAGLERADVHHVPDVLYHRQVKRFMRANLVRPAASGIDHGATLVAFAADAGFKARLCEDQFGNVRLCRPVPQPAPLVSLIIPTRDTLRLTRKCVRSILEKTTYPNYELLIVDNDSSKPATLKFFDRIAGDARVRILKYPGEFNYSAINNFAAGEARGAFIGLINNDTEVITPEWLDELVAEAARPDAGAVGAKLLYADGRIQHAGVFTGMGKLAGHGHRFLKNDAPGYFYRAHLSQYVSAVTGACLVVAKAKFDAVGGLDAEHLKVAFNDVDLCLKLQAAGYHNIYVPHAVLYHYESKSRGKDLKGEKRARYLGEAAVLQERWGTDTEVDRYHNRNLSLHREDFGL
ncbi:MAG: glycosyltransferase [Alphaproteobacteria bacterium]|nr:MAG: glycosyltransferase [Alphaproteobacteria bacterium]